MGRPELLLLKSDHTYWLGDYRIPGITEIIGEPPEFASIKNKDEVLRLKAMLGRVVHKACELDDLGTLDISTLAPQAEPYLRAWREFRSLTRFTPVVSEYKGYSDIYRYAGTIDRAGVIGRRMVVVEIKTVSKVSPTTALQTAAQAQIMNESGFTIDGRFAVRLCSDGRIEVPKEFTDRSDLNTFLAMLQVRQWKIRNYPLMTL